MRARFAALFVVATACTFPDITVVVQDDQVGGGGGSSLTTANTGGAPATTSTESTTSTMTTTSSTTMSNGGGGMGGSGGGECPDVDGMDGPSILCGGTDCDDDGDGVQVEFEGCCVAPGCDCNDRNGDVFPGQENWFGGASDGADDYDYNCSNFPEPRYTTECPQSGLGILNCGDGKVFLDENLPPCGQNGNAKTCAGLGLGTCYVPSGGTVYSLQQECH